MPKFFEPQHSVIQEPNASSHEYFEDYPYDSKVGEGGEIRTLLEWIAPSRPFRQKDRSFYTTIAVIITLIALIALLAQEFLLIAVLFALTFVVYALNFVPPNDIKYKISTQGITIEEHFYFWHEMESFWFKEKEGQNVLFIQTYLSFPAQLMLVLGSMDKDEIQKTVAHFLPFHEIPRTTFLDRWGEKLQKYFPLENIHS